MKILIFNWQDIKNPLGGGAEVHLHQIFSRVARMGHEVTLFCSSFPGAPPEEIIDGIHVIREGGRYFFNAYVPLRYWTRFRHEHYDVVLDDTNKIPFFTPLFVHEPIAVIVHHLFDTSIFREAPLPLALYVYCAERLGVLLNRNRRLPMMVVSPSTKEELLAKGYRSEDIQYIYNCVDHTVHSPSPQVRSTTPLIGYFGRLKKYKSADHLLQAFARVRNSVPDLRLVLIGEGDDRARLERLSREIGIADAVRFTGYVDEATKVRFLQESWFMVNTSAKEGWGLTVVEANACGTTVIGSNVPGLRDAIKDRETGLLYEYGNIEELAAKMLLLINDAPLRNRLADAALKWSQTFDWNVVAKETVDHLKTVIEQGRRMKH